VTLISPAPSADKLSLPGPRVSPLAYALLITVFVIATCGLIYELIAGTVASYLLGDSITQFSTVIGVYLFSMGVGSYLSRWIKTDLISCFVQVELLIAIVGGCSASILFLAFQWISGFQFLLYGLVGLTGVLVGLEIPLLMRILKAHFEFDDLVAHVFTFDYVGALLASLLFPLFLVPYLGLIRSAFLFGLLNALVAVWTMHLLRPHLKHFFHLRFAAFFVIISLITGIIFSEQLMSLAESWTYPDNVIFSKSSPYQRIVLTHQNGDLRLFLNGNLQFSSRDEYRYHEALVHVGLAGLENPKHILVLGGGDGLAVRELLKYPSIESITLVDLDSAVTNLFRGNDSLRQLNQNALDSPKLKVINQDAFVWLKQYSPVQNPAFHFFDFIVVDFPDPSNFSIGKLYSTTFYQALSHLLSPQGRIVVQSTSPYYAKESFWCVVSTLNAVGLNTTPYHAYVPAFGDWGYVLAGKTPFKQAKKYPKNSRYVSTQSVAGMFVFPQDMRSQKHLVNKLNNQVLVQTFEREWAPYVDVH
jgi:spermidine synthase